MANNQNDNLMTFGEHLEVFRRMLFRIIAITICLTVVIFCLRILRFIYCWLRVTIILLLFICLKRYSNGWKLIFVSSHIQYV